MRFRGSRWSARSSSPAQGLAGSPVCWVSWPWCSRCSMLPAVTSSLIACFSCSRRRRSDESGRRTSGVSGGRGTLHRGPAAPAKSGDGTERQCHFGRGYADRDRDDADHRGDPLAARHSRGPAGGFGDRVLDGAHSEDDVDAADGRVAERVRRRCPSSRRSRRVSPIGHRGRTDPGGYRHHDPALDPDRCRDLYGESHRLGQVAGSHDRQADHLSRPEGDQWRACTRGGGPERVPADDCESLLWPFYAVVAISLLLGVLLVIPIGGADMPVVIALLNSYSGIAAAMTGFVIDNSVLIISGALVGSSGIILSQIMCKAMNRSLANVLFGAFGAAGPSGSAKSSAGMSVRSVTPEDAAIQLAYAQSVVVIPGYGMAVAQAQHAVREIQELIEKRGGEVKYAIHPVAGRMPGHMNVLLAEANVSYDKLREMDDINPEMDRVDVAVVIGANDVVNP